MELFLYVVLSLYIETDIKQLPQEYCDKENTQVIYSTGNRGTMIEDVAFYVGDVGVCKYYPGTQKEIKGKKRVLNYIHGLAFHLWYTKLSEQEQQAFPGDHEDFANTMEYLYLNGYKSPPRGCLLTSECTLQLQVKSVKNLLEKKFGQ